jgi:transposase-like protein
MLSLQPEHRKVNGHAMLTTAFSEAQATVQQQMSARLNQLLTEGVDHLLGRGAYVRRASVPANWEQSGRCCHCKTQHCDHFSRNGYRPRTLNCLDYQLQLQLPRVVCQCGGSVALDFSGLLRPYQRLSDEVDARLQRWGKMGHSLRDMQAELRHCHLGPLGLRTLCERLHQLQDLTPGADELVTPPVVQVDAIWFTQLCATGQLRRDAKGRLRPVKSRRKRCLLIALGVWPDSGRCVILAWQLADREDTQAWLAFLTHLEEHGVRGENGLQLIIHDGGDGLCAALQIVHFDAADQRCLFHKLRNIANALQLPEGLPRPERTRQRRAMLKDFQAIWAAKEYATVLRRYLQVVRQYRETQPDAVATLRRDFRATVTYYHIQQRHPTWHRRHLRTTSRLERFNRTLRRHIRTAGAYHSDDGILAVIAQEADYRYPSNRRVAQS